MKPREIEGAIDHGETHRAFALQLHVFHVNQRLLQLASKIQIGGPEERSVKCEIARHGRMLGNVAVEESAQQRINIQIGKGQSELRWEQIAQPDTAFERELSVVIMRVSA